MENLVMDDEIGRYFRRLQLGCRLLAHGARAKTTAQWTGLTRDQLVTLRRRWRFDAAQRPRGRSPSSLREFFRSTVRATEATLAVLIARVLGAVPLGSDVKRLNISLENGERVCEALEIFRVLAPDSTLTCEDFILLLLGASEGREIVLTPCEGCGTAMLADVLGSARPRCVPCERGFGESARGRKRKYRVCRPCTSAAK